jgi:hypothetical protein
MPTHVLSLKARNRCALPRLRANQPHNSSLSLGDNQEADSEKMKQTRR